MTGTQDIKPITVLSKKAAKEFESEGLWACISVCCPDDSFANVSRVKQLDLLQLRFWDRDFARVSDDPEFVFNEGHAKEVWDFVEKNWDKIDELMVHCLMGQSRSAGIAAAISKVKYGSDQSYFEAFTPNMLIYRKLLDEANSRGLI